MSDAVAIQQGLNLRSIAEAITPGQINFDPFGFVSGYKAYQIYTALDAKSDTELSALGLQRTDLPRVAMSAVNEVRQG